MTEAELQSAVIDLAHLLKWRVAHFRPAMNAKGQWRTAVAGDGAGFPDLVLVRDRVIFAELKSGNGRVSLDQRGWMDALRSAGCLAVIWKPGDWANGTVEAILR